MKPHDSKAPQRNTPLADPTAVPGRSRWPFLAVNVVLVFLSALAAWKLFEMDVFWALRAGQEIVDKRAIPMTEPMLCSTWMTKTFSSFPTKSATPLLAGRMPRIWTGTTSCFMGRGWNR